MSFPEPVPGLVIRYSYLWAAEYGRGQEEGSKDRPCAIILTSTDQHDGRVVPILPVTHLAPTNPAFSLEIPAMTKHRLGLDDAPSWVVLSEANRFLWPGPDLRPLRRGDMASVAYGQLPYALFETIRQKFIAALRARRAGVVPRSE